MGRRQIGDPSIDLTDLFAFTSPEDAGRTVLVANVFPSAGASALFSNAAIYAICVRRATVAGTGDTASFKTGAEEFRFTCRFDTLQPGPDGKSIQRGTCTLPDGQKLPLRRQRRERRDGTGRRIPYLCRLALRSVLCWPGLSASIA